MNAERFSDWPWRDFGHFGMSERTAEREAAHAQLLAEKSGLPGTSAPWPVSAWVPWAQCNAAEFAAAGVGVA